MIDGKKSLSLSGLSVYSCFFVLLRVVSHVDSERFCVTLIVSAKNWNWKREPHHCGHMSIQTE